MKDADLSRRLTLAALMLAPVAVAGCARAQDDEAACPELVGHVARFLCPNDVATMDYNPERVNIYHDDDFRIVRIAWG